MLLQTGEAESAEAVCAGALDQHPEDANLSLIHISEPTRPY